MQKDDALLSRARVAGKIEHVAGVYRRDGSRYIGEVLCGVARQVSMMKPEQQQPLSMDELGDLLVSEGAEGRVWLEYRHEERFERVGVAEAMKPLETRIKDRKKPVPAYGVSVRAWLELPNEEERKAAKWEK